MNGCEWDIKVTSKGQITLPKQVREMMMVREGDHLQAVVRDEAIVLTKRVELSDSEQMRLAAVEMLKALGSAEDISDKKQLSDRRRQRARLNGAYPDLARLVREGRERR